MTLRRFKDENRPFGIDTGLCAVRGIGRPYPGMGELPIDGWFKFVQPQIRRNLIWDWTNAVFIDGPSLKLVDEI
jgi:hypothetical protein